MTPAQTSLYFREWAKVRAHFIAKGIDPKQADHKRHELHRKALGADKSSKSFTNADLDKVLGVFRAITQPGDLTAQLNALDQPEHRRGRAEAQCRGLVRQLPQIKEAADPSFYADNYLDTLSRSVCGCRFAQCNEQQLARIYGILKHRLGDTVRQEEERLERADKNPF